MSCRSQTRILKYFWEFDLSSAHSRKTKITRVERKLVSNPTQTHWRHQTNEYDIACVPRGSTSWLVGTLIVIDNYQEHGLVSSSVCVAQKFLWTKVCRRFWTFMQMLSTKDVHSAALKTVRVSRRPTTIMTAKKSVERNEEATVSEWGISTHANNKKFLCVRLWKGIWFCRRVLLSFFLLSFFFLLLSFRIVSSN